MTRHIAWVVLDDPSELGAANVRLTKAGWSVEIASDADEVFTRIEGERRSPDGRAYALVLSDAAFERWATVARPGPSLPAVVVVCRDATNTLDPLARGALGVVASNDLSQLANVVARAVALARSLAAVRLEMLASLDDRIAELDAVLAQPRTRATAEEARRLSHRLRGSAGSVGLAEIAALAGQMEQLLGAADLAIPENGDVHATRLRASIRDEQRGGLDTRTAIAELRDAARRARLT